MRKVSINPKLAKLPFKEFKKWVERKFPGEDAEKLYVLIGGKVPAKKEKGAE